MKWILVLVVQTYAGAFDGGRVAIERIEYTQHLHCQQAAERAVRELRSVNLRVSATCIQQQ